MIWTRVVRALMGWAGGGRLPSRPPVGKARASSHFVDVKGRPMRLTVSEHSPDSLVAATEAGEHPLRKASGALQLRGLARVDGQLIALHDVEGTAKAERRPEESQPVSS